jgi:hypothetical protein
MRHNITLLAMAVLGISPFLLSQPTDRASTASRPVVITRDPCYWRCDQLGCVYVCVGEERSAVATTNHTCGLA